MNNKSVILKVDNQAQISISKSLEGIGIQRVTMPISPLNFIKLFHVADSKVNPRKAKINLIVKAIEETLEYSPELYYFYSKGILLSTLYFDLFDRNRVRLSFSNDEIEGIMDGGHNTFAIARYIAKILMDKDLKTWDDCIKYYQDELTFNKLIKECELEKYSTKLAFSIPIEVISPIDNDEESIEYYSNHILEICSARNANVSLTESTKSNKEGLYEELKNCLKGSYKDNIAWRSGENGKIKSDDVVALACLPLIKLSECNYFDENSISTLNRISLYSQKSTCIKYYRKLMKDPQISKQQLGKYELIDSAVKSGFDLVDDIIKFFDKLYYYFPLIYNYNAGSFGRIKGVTQKENELGGYLNKYSGQFNTFDKKSTYNYAYGFFYPIICGLTSLMKFENKKLSWIINPMDINLESDKIKSCFGIYTDAIKEMQYDPQKVGKSSFSYKLADIVIKNIINDLV